MLVHALHGTEFSNLVKRVTLLTNMSQGLLFLVPENSSLPFHARTLSAQESLLTIGQQRAYEDIYFL